MRSEIFHSLTQRQKIGVILVTSLSYCLLITFIQLGFDAFNWVQAFQALLFETPFIAGYVYLLGKGIDRLFVFFETNFPAYHATLVRLLVPFLIIILFSTLLLTTALLIPEKLMEYLPAMEVPARGMHTMMRHVRLLYVLNAIFACFLYSYQAERQLHRRLAATELAQQTLEKESYQAQFELLSSHVSPHFLFNNLNTLAALIQKDPSSATQFLGQFSSLFRHVLEYRGKELIPLQSELSLIKAYIYLLKARFRDNIRITIELSGEEEHYLIPSLTLQPLLEGAIRRNIISTEYPLSIDIRVDKNHRLIFTNGIRKRNDVAAYTGKEPELEAIKRRFYLFTPERVEMRHTHDEFIISLPLIENAPASMAS